MNAEERSKLPPPECCRSCWHYSASTNADGVTRSECRHPYNELMHPNCGFHEDRTPSLIGETK